MIVQRPVITEKSLGLAAQGWYTFAVPKHARKETIAKEIERIYRVNVTDIRTVPMHGKVRRTGKRMVSESKIDWKKAVAKLKAGQKIDAFEVTAQAPAAEESKPAAAKTMAGKEAKETTLETQQKGKIKK